MTTLASPSAVVTDSRLSRAMPVLLLLFAGSGCAALIYEIVWFQLLQLVIGSSAVSIGVLLGTFMGGMCLGSLLLSRFISARRSPLQVYAILELAIGVVGLGVTFLMPLVDRGYIAMASPGAGAIFLRAMICALCLLPPTMLMGATLPAISRWVESTPRGVAWLGFFYGGNTVGAVAGSLLAGFYLLRVHDMTFAVCTAAAINGVVGVLGLVLAEMAGRAEATPAVRAGEREKATADGGRGPVYVAIALSGMSALGAEVVWTRLLSLLLGGTVYTFSIILAVFLTGLGVGSSVGAMVARNRTAREARTALAWCQLLCAVGIAWTACAVTSGLPSWPINPYIAMDAGYGFTLDVARCLWAILLPTLFWGASFPLALAAAMGEKSADPARVVGRVYAANTVGAIAGALLLSLFVIPAFGTQQAEHFLIVVAAAGAVAAIVGKGFGREATKRMVMLALAVAVPVVLIGWLQSSQWDALPWRLVAYGRQIQMTDRNSPNTYYANKLYLGEGINSSVAVTELADQSRRFHVSGKVEASSLPEDMRLQLMLGHFPALFHPKPEKVLIVGCGAGVTAGTFVLHPSIKKIVICEIEPLIPSVVATYFSAENNGIVSRDSKGAFIDPRVEVVYDDARHYILTTKEKFDIITSDPIHPWVKGAATLYTEEYFNLVKQHLNPGGLVTQWVPLYESNEPAVKSEIATFFKAFPDGTVWSNDVGGEGYDVVVMGKADGEPFTLDGQALQRRLEAHPLVARAMANSSFNSVFDILRTYAGRATELESWTRDAQINSDRNLRLQYLAGESLNQYEASTIIRKITARRTFPKGMITVEPSTQTGLEQVWSTGRQTP